MFPEALPLILKTRKQPYPTKELLEYVVLLFKTFLKTNDMGKSFVIHWENPVKNQYDTNVF